MGFKRLTIHFEVGRYAWSEAYAYNSTTTPFSDIADNAAGLVIWRAYMLGIGATITKAFLSDSEFFRDQYPVRLPSKVTNGSYNNDWPATAPYHCDFPFMAIPIRCASNNNNNKLIYLSGVPDAVTWTADVRPSTFDPAFLAAFNGFVRNLKNNWAWVGVKSPEAGATKSSISSVSVVQNQNNFVLKFGAAPGYLEGQTILVRGAKTRGGKLNGRATITQTASAGTIITLDKLAPDPFSYLGGGYTFPLDYTLFPITGALFQDITHRKRGGRYDLPRGRR